MRYTGMNNLLGIYLSFVVLVLSKTVAWQNEEQNVLSEVDSEEYMKLAGKRAPNPANEDDKSCWLTLNAKKLFNTMDKLDARFERARNYYHKTVADEQFDKQMLDAMLQSRGTAQRDIHNADANPNKIPAGLNLGGYCMIKLPDSMLFFHRVKLRNNTIFQVNYLHSDLMNMVLTARLSLNDLHLIGSYERAIIDSNPSNLFYKPTFGQLELLLKNVQYKMEGRYRMLKDRLTIELVVSEMLIDQVLLLYRNQNETMQEPISLEVSVIEEFVERLKADLNKWLKDYFNDYLIYFGLAESAVSSEFEQYDKLKAIALNAYVDEALDLIKKRLRQLRTVNVKLPDFSIFTVNGLQVRLRDGVLRGLDSIYRTAVSTGRRESKFRYVNTKISFGKLKVEYRYEAILNNGVPPLTGLFILASDHISADMGMTLIEDPETAELTIQNLRQIKPESLTVEGSVNRMLSMFKHILENQITAIMSNTMMYHIRLLKTITKCEPAIPGHIDPGETFSDEEETTQASIELPNNPALPNEGRQRYVVYRKDSIELEVPVEPNQPAKKMHLNYNETFAISDIKL